MKTLPYLKGKSLQPVVAFVNKEREKAEETVKLQRLLQTERELMWAARLQAKREELQTPLNALESF